MVAKASFSLAELPFGEYSRNFDDGYRLAANELTKDLHIYNMLSFKFDWALRRCILDFNRNALFLIWSVMTHGLQYVESGQ